MTSNFEKSCLNAFHNCTLQFFCHENNQITFAIPHIGYASSNQVILALGNAFATALETLPSPHPISKNLSQAFKSKIVVSLSISFLLVGTQGAIDFPAIAIGSKTSSITTENKYSIQKF
jgi:hypothetical protein